MNEFDPVVRLQRGDRTALNDLFATYAHPAIRTAYSITRIETVAEDAVQEAFIQVIRTIGSLRDPTSFRPWFYRIVVNAAKRLSRNAYRSVPLDLDEHDKPDLSAITPDEAAMGVEEIALLWEAIADLDEAHRVPIVLRYFTGLSERETAEVIGIPQGTVKSRLHSARKLLYERIEGEHKAPTVSILDRSAELAKGVKNR